MNEKHRLGELFQIFMKLAGVFDEHRHCYPGKVGDYYYDSEGFIFELNGYEGLLVWAPNGRFYQLSYKNADTWNVTMFPYDIYGKRTLRFDERGEMRWVSC